MQHQKSAKRKECNMKNSNMGREQYEKREAGKERNIKELQRKKSET